MIPSDIILNDEDIDCIGGVNLRRDEDRPETIRLETGAGTIQLGGDGQFGQLTVTDRAGDGAVFVHGEQGDITAEGTVTSQALVSNQVWIRTGGSLTIEDTNGQVVVELAGDGTLRVAEDIIVGSGASATSLSSRIDELQATIEALEARIEENDSRVLVPGDD